MTWAGWRPRKAGNGRSEADRMGKKKKARRESDCLRIAPEQRIAGKFDAASIAKFPVAEPGKMGFRVLDDCAEEHQM